MRRKDKMSMNKSRKVRKLKLITKVVFVLSIIVAFSIVHSIAQATDSPELLLMGIRNHAGADDFWFHIGSDVNSSGYASSWQGGVAGGLGHTSAGGGLAMGYINDNDIPDVVFMHLNDWDPNDFRYKIGFDFNVNNGSWGSWSGGIQGPADIGLHSDGGGATIGYINDNERPDLLLMAVDDPDGANSFRYYIGWDLDTNGSPASWSGMISVGGIGHYTAGGGATIGYIDGDPRPDLILMGVNDWDPNDFRYKVGLNLGTDGRTQNWSYIGAHALGHHNQGGGATLSYVNNNGIPDLILMAIDNPHGDNSFWYHIGFDLGTNGQPERWGYIVGPTIPGHENDGGGAALVGKPLTQLQLVSPAKGSNDKVNVALNEPVTFEVNFADNRFNVNLAGAQWWYISEADPEDRRDFTTTSTGEKQYTFWDVGDYIIYCRVIEEVSGRKSVSRTIAIPVRVWNRPTVASTPPQAHIDAGDVSWFNGKYVGVKDQAVRLMADGNTENNDPNEYIEKYLWDFNNNWSTVEVEQVAYPTSEVVSNIWENPNENAQVRCKAVTNYGIMSHADNEQGQTFNLTIYDTLQVDPGGPYTSRTNATVELKGSVMNLSAYQGASVEYQWRVNSTIPTPNLYGDAVAEEDYIRLTQAVNNVNGQLDYVDDDNNKLVLSDNWSVTGEFKSGGGTGPNVFYIYVWANGVPAAENENKDQYSIIFNEYVNKIMLYDAPNIVTEELQSTPLYNNQWRPFRVVFNGGTFQVYLDYNLKLEHTVSNYQSRQANNIHCGFGARNGSLNSIHHIRNMVWTPGEPVDTKSQGEAEYTWITEGTHFAGLTARISTPEGLVLEETAFVEVSVEAGKPTAMPGGPYRGGIAGGDFTPIQFEGNHPDFIEAIDVGPIEDWQWTFAGFSLLDDNVDELISHLTKGGGTGQKTTTEPYSGQASLRVTPLQIYNSDIPGWSFEIVENPTRENQYRYITFAWRKEGGSGILLQLFGEPGGWEYRYHAGQTHWTPSTEVSASIPQEWEVVTRDLFADFGTFTLKGIAFTPIDGTAGFWDNVCFHKKPEPPVVKSGVWNPTHEFVEAGQYDVALRILANSGKWSSLTVTEVKAIDGKIAGYVRAADLRTPVREVQLVLTSSHVARDALVLAASADDQVFTTADGGLQTETDANGYFEFSHLPLGGYRIRVFKGEGDSAHEFEKTIHTTELTLNGPNQLAIDFVDLSVFPVGGRVVYSIKKNNQDVLVGNVKVKAYPIGSTSFVEALPSRNSLSATGVNYSMPLFAGKYLFVPELSQHDIRIKEDISVYDSATGLVLIETARTDIDFVDHTTRDLTVFVQDSGGYPITEYPDNGNPIEVTVSGDNGQVSDEPVDENGKIFATLNPGIYTVTIPGANPETEEVDLTGDDDTITMTIPVKIELTLDARPKLLDVSDEFLAQFGIDPSDNPEGYMYYYPPEPRTHTYTITATANGNPVEDFTLFVTDEVSMMTPDAPEEQEAFVPGDEGEYTILAGLPKQTTDEPPLAASKQVTFKGTKDGYLNSDPLDDLVTVLGDVAIGTAAKIISVPVVNYTVLHDPPGDGSHSNLEDSMVIRGLLTGMQIQLEDENIPVYPSPWRSERKVKDFEFEKEPGSDTQFKDMGDKGLLGYRNSDPALGHFTWAALLEVGTGAGIVATGPVGYALQVAKLGIKAAAITPVGTSAGVVQYQVNPERNLATPSGDDKPDILGPGKGDVYFGEGWTLGLQTKHRLGIEWNENTEQWDLTTATIETYDILERTNQYIYTIRDIEKIIADLTNTINALPDGDEKTKLTNAKSTWLQLLNSNLAYIWQRDYASQGRPLDKFIDERGGSLGDSETLIFSAGLEFEYSREIAAEHTVEFTTEIGVESGSEMGHEFETSAGAFFFGTGAMVKIKLGSSASVGSSTSFGASWESGYESEQSVGFVLNDDDVGDNIATRVYADPKWGTPLFFQEPGSYTSDPWEPGTNKNVDVTMELLESPSNRFDYHDGAHSKVKLTYTGQRELEAQGIDFLLLSGATDNTDNLTVRFNGNEGPYLVELSKGAPAATIIVSVYPSEMDMDNSDEQQYGVALAVEEAEDPQIGRELSFNVSFADMRSPRAIVMAPYDGERVSPVFFPPTTPFKIGAVSEDTDLKSIQLQIRSKQPDGVWEPWYNLSGMYWEDGGANTNVTVFDRLDREPPRREFTYLWNDAGIQQLGVGEYALRAVATDKATRIDLPGFPGNVDIDPPFVVFLVDEAKPSVLCSIPDYQARESERIYRGELSVTFTDDMRSTDFDDRTFYVMDLLNNNEKVAGYVSYSPALRKTIFVPIVPFQPNGFYRVEIKTDVDTDGDEIIDEAGVHDLAGNPLDNAFMWTFRTTDAPFEPTWSLTFSVEDGVPPTEGGGYDANNIAAVEYGAIDDEDEKDVRAVPALASQLSFSYLNRDKVEFDRDIRPADGRLSHHWFFVICDAENGSTVTIRYRPSIKLTKSTRQYQVLRLVEFNQSGQVTNTIPLDPTQAQVDPDTGLIPEIEAYTYTNQGEASRYFRLDVQKVGFVAGAFEVGTSGWKFFSVPIYPQRAEPFVNLGDDIDPFRLYQYDTALGGYKVYPFDIGEVGLQTGHGYFTRLEQNVEVDIGGASNYDDVILQLDAAGWHPIGNPFLLPVDVASLEVNGQTFDSAVASGLVEGTLYRWNIISENAAFLSDVAISDSYEAVTNINQLNTWEGYWLKTNQAITLTIPAPPNLPQNPPLPERYDPPMAPLLESNDSIVAQAMTQSLHSKGQFDLKLALTSDFASDLTTTLGTRQNAQVDWDAFDSTEPPILGKTVAAYFEHADWEEKNGQYNHDYQPALGVGEERIWKFVVYTKNPDSEMNLSWKEAIAQVPGDIMLYFRQSDVAAEFNPATWQDMRKVQSVKLTSHLQSTKIPFEVRAERFEMSPISDVEVIAGTAQVLLRWGSGAVQSRHDNPFISGYTITRQVAEFARIQGDARTLASSATYNLGPNANQFIDTDVFEETTYTYQVTVHFKSGAELKSDLFTVTVLPVIKKTALLQSYPNPFNPETWIPYELEKDATVSLEIYNAAGQLVRTLELGQQPRGRYISKSKAVRWDGRTEFGERAASGLYFYVLKAGNFKATRKMVIIK